MKTEKLSPVQVMTMTIGAIFGVDILRVQHGLVSIAGRDAWISLMLGGILTIITGLLLYMLNSLYYDKDWPEMLLHIGGNFFGRILIIPSAVYTLLYSGFSIRIFTQALKMFLLDRTPIYAVVVFMIVVVIYAVYHGIHVIANLVDIIFPICMITVISIILLSLQQADIQYLKPVMFENTGNVIKGISAAFKEFTGFGIISYLLCHTNRSKSTIVWYSAGIAVSIVFYVLFTVVTIAVFGGRGTLNLVYPTLTLTKSIEFPATFLERLESFVAILWIGIVFMSMILFCHMSIRDLMVFFNVKDTNRKYLVWALIPILTITALIVKSGVKVLKLFEVVKTIPALMTSMVLPLLFFAWRKKKKEMGK